MALPAQPGAVSGESNGRIVTHGDVDHVYFLCNICGTASGVRPGQLQREVASCPTCNSTVRFRSVIHVLSVELFGESLVLTDFPVRKDIRGIGMSDWGVYAALLGEKLDYMNTFFDEPAITRHHESRREVLGEERFRHLLGSTRACSPASLARLREPAATAEARRTPGFHGPLQRKRNYSGEFSAISISTSWFSKAVAKCSRT